MQSDNNNNNNNTTPMVDMALTTSSILQHLSQVNDQHRDPNEFVSKFHASCVPDVSVVDYMARLRQYSRCSNGVYVVAFIYVDRIQQHPKITLNSLTVHRLVLTSMMLAAKYVDDHHYNNALFAKLGGVHRDELNSLELEFLFTVAFNLHVSEDEYARYERELLQHAAWMNARLQAQQQPQQQVSIQQQQPECTQANIAAVTAPNTPASSSSSSSSSNSSSPVHDNNNNKSEMCQDMEQEEQEDEEEEEEHDEEEEYDVEDEELDVLCDEVEDVAHSHKHNHNNKMSAFVTSCDITASSSSTSSSSHKQQHECSPASSVSSGASVSPASSVASARMPVVMV